jgi:surfactin synthase thioesterase subunit
MDSLGFPRRTHEQRRRSYYQAASRELIAKLIKAGYLQPALRNDADAHTTAIAQLKEDLRGGGDDEGPRAA